MTDDEIEKLATDYFEATGLDPSTKLYKDVLKAYVAGAKVQRALNAKRSEVGDER